MGERRDPTRQRPKPGGERHDDPPVDELLNPAQCAARLGLKSSSFVIGEIRDGRLQAALVLERPGKRTIYRVHPAALEAYKHRYHWTYVPTTARAPRS